MNHLTITQRIKMIKTNQKSVDSTTASYRALRGDYGPTTQAIGKIVKKFEETEVLTNIERPVHNSFARCAKNIAIV